MHAEFYIHCNMTAACMTFKNFRCTSRKICSFLCDVQKFLQLSVITFGKIFFSKKSIQCLIVFAKFSMFQSKILPACIDATCKNYMFLRLRYIERQFRSISESEQLIHSVRNCFGHKRGPGLT